MTFNDGDNITITFTGEIVTNSYRDNLLVIRLEDNRKFSFDPDRASSIVLNSHKKFEPGDVVMANGSGNRYLILANLTVAELSTGLVHNVDENFLTSLYYTKVEV